MTYAAFVLEVTDWILDRVCKMMDLGMLQNINIIFAISGVYSFQILYSICNTAIIFYLYANLLNYVNKEKARSLSYCGIDTFAYLVATFPGL